MLQGIARTHPPPGVAEKGKGDAIEVLIDFNKNLKGGPYEGLKNDIDNELTPKP